MIWAGVHWERGVPGIPPPSVSATCTRPSSSCKRTTFTRMPRFSWCGYFRPFRDILRTPSVRVRTYWKCMNGSMWNLWTNCRCRAGAIRWLVRVALRKCDFGTLSREKCFSCVSIFNDYFFRRFGKKIPLYKSIKSVEFFGAAITFSLEMAVFDISFWIFPINFPEGDFSFVPINRMQKINLSSSLLTHDKKRAFFWKFSTSDPYPFRNY